MQFPVKLYSITMTILTLTISTHFGGEFSTKFDQLVCQSKADEAFLSYINSLHLSTFNY